MYPTQGAKPSSSAMGAGTMPCYYQQLYQQYEGEQRQELQNFWNEQYKEIENTSNIKKHSLPLARIKKIMKADEDVSMIAVEATVLLARACEMFILELTHRSWAHAEENKRRTLHKNDIGAAITRTDLFDFLVDMLPREEDKELMFGAGLSLNPNHLHMQCYYAPKQEEEMEIGMEIRDWAELIPDALSIIFNHLSLQEKLMVVPSVCKSWGRVVSSPYCWQEIDLEQWSRSCTCEKLDWLLRMLITRSSGSFSKLAVHGLRADALFSFVADNAGSLRTLIIPGNSISDSIIEQVANRLTNITTLDLSYSTKMSAKALEAFGKNCENLTVLHYSNFTVPVDRTLDQDDEAFAISSTMPNLLRLEVPSLRLTDKGVHEILSKCKKLELLNIDGCWNVTIEQELLKEKYPNVKVIYEPDDQEDDDDYDYQYYQYDPSSDGDSDYGHEFILAAYGLL